jgi:LytS/YehU family sensor histidine kinase
MEKNAMRSQIKPHFIFNSLTNIQYLYNMDTAKGNEALTKFSRHLRANIEVETKEIISFKEELDNILNYVDLVNMRRSEETNFLLNCEAFDFCVPVLSLQPFVENALKYSMADEKEDGFVEISSMETDDSYIVEVVDNGVGFDASAVKSTSTGLRNATERLHMTLNAVVDIDSQIGVGTKIKIIIPKETE